MPGQIPGEARPQAMARRPSPDTANLEVGAAEEDDYVHSPAVDRSYFFRFNAAAAACMTGVVGLIRQ